MPETKKNVSSRIRDLLATDSWHHLQYRIFDSQSRGKRRSTTLILYGQRFKGFVTIWAKNFNTPLQTANMYKEFLGLVCNWVPIHPVSLQLKHNVFIFFVSSTKPVTENFYTILYIVPLHSMVDAGNFLQNFWHNFSHNICFTVYHIHLILPNGLFYSGFTIKILYAFLFCPIHT
jgi:hypothetical protein